MTGKPKIACVGAGRMGRGIGHVFAYAGHPVTIIDFKPREDRDARRLAAEGRAEIETNMRFLESLGVMTGAQVEKAMALISFAALDGAMEPLAQADYIFEGVLETREAKADALGRASAIAREDAVIASTTSTMLVTELQALVTRPQRFLNTHFLNPAHLIPLIEVSPGPATDETVVAATIGLFEAIGKVPVRCAASPGYIIPRLQSLLLSETARMVAEGVAAPEDIDKAIKAGFGPRYATMGAVEFIDWGGVDIVYYAGNYLAQALNSPAHKPPPDVERMMEEGRKGLRERQGYYDFRNIDVEAYQRETLTRLVDLMKFLGQLPPPGVDD